MGTQFWTKYLTWPTGTPGARINISLSDNSTSNTKVFDGEWALFRLLGDASFSQGETSSQFIFNWEFYKENFYDVTVRYILEAKSSREPFSKNFFKSFSLPNKIN
jgi:type VI protein secretion system component VasK